MARDASERSIERGDLKNWRDGEQRDESTSSQSIYGLTEIESERRSLSSRCLSEDRAQISAYPSKGRNAEKGKRVMGNKNGHVTKENVDKENSGRELPTQPTKQKCERAQS